MWFASGSQEPVFYSGGGMDGKPDWLVYWVMQRVTKQAQGSGSKLVAVEHLLQELFHWFDGYDCTAQELKGLDNAVKPRTWIARQLVGPEASVYGEVLPEGVQAVLDEISKEMPFSEEDVFYDLGSGTGKVAIQASLVCVCVVAALAISQTTNTSIAHCFVHLPNPFVPCLLPQVTPCRKVVGIELADTRHQHATRALEEAQKLAREMSAKSKRQDESTLLSELVRKWETKGLELLQGDITETTYQDGTHLFAASTTWPDSLLADIAANLCTKVPRVKTFSTLREIEDQDLEKHPEMTLWRKIKVDVSWTDAAEMHIYRFDLSRQLGSEKPGGAAGQPGCDSTQAVENKKNK